MAAVALVLVLLFGGAVVLGQVVVRPADAVGTPSHSRLRLVESAFPPRQLTAEDIRRGGRTCLEGNILVVAPGGGGCTFILPHGVHVVVFDALPGSSAMTITLTQTGDLTQTVDTGRPGPDPSDPLRWRFATVREGTTVTFSGCRGPASCRLALTG
ncbi:MAG: hypothetical protein QOF81_1714 [Acidimicrobiaceae bacterium]|jgi:hypothetical protein|nr:hypothetical protein [Acidimicrobiaceae bacterium]